MSRRHTPTGPLQPFVFRLSDAQRLAVEVEARRQGKPVAVLLREIFHWYLTQVPPAAPTAPEVTVR
jgi:hypothetical protein